MGPLWVLGDFKGRRVNASPPFKTNSMSKDRRDIYLMERFHWSCIPGWLIGERQIKIGISNNTKRRQKENTRNMAGWFKTIYRREVPNAEKLETELHRHYKADKHPIKGNGGTEIFKLNNRQIRQVKNKAKGKQVNRQVGELQMLTALSLGIGFVYLLTHL